MQPLANDLLQQLPTGIIQLSSLQMQMAQQGEAALQLQQQHLSAYLPLLLSQQHHSSSVRSDSVVNNKIIQMNAVPSFRQQPLCHHLFELQQQQQRGGWCVPSYSVYLHDRLDCELTEDDDRSAAAAAEAGQQQQQGVTDTAADSLLQLLPQRCGRHVLILLLSFAVRHAD
jgi:hypothetical protein